MSQIYQKSEVAERNGKNGQPVWMIYKGNVYDVTTFIKDHPGGPELILEVAGKDATKAFNNAGHSPDAVQQLKQYKIGEVAIDAQPKPQTANGKSADPGQTKQPQPQQAEKSGGFLCCC
ncbi:cytochrome b5 type B [Drosophila novamexicana]|uniref:cytochrome b5 type B n=1 Tax=Drosophila novamexicana TaxID=47314 RepID=UPI0011E5A94D|nr:cytochrome b5 type B [Drosophila novamexicana]